MNQSENITLARLSHIQKLLADASGESLDQFLLQEAGKELPPPSAALIASDDELARLGVQILETLFKLAQNDLLSFRDVQASHFNGILASITRALAARTHGQLDARGVWEVEIFNQPLEAMLDASSETVFGEWLNSEIERGHREHLAISRLKTLRKGNSSLTDLILKINGSPLPTSSIQVTTFSSGSPLQTVRHSLDQIDLALVQKNAPSIVFDYTTAQHEGFRDYFYVYDPREGANGIRLVCKDSELQLRGSSIQFIEAAMLLSFLQSPESCQVLVNTTGGNRKSGAKLGIANRGEKIKSEVEKLIAHYKIEGVEIGWRVASKDGQLIYPVAFKTPLLVLGHFNADTAKIRLKNLLDL